MTLQESQQDTGLESLEGVEPEALDSWASEAPLKLVAWALESMGRRGTSRDIREKLEGRFVREPGWNVWWARVRLGMKAASRQFRMGSNNAVTLLTNAVDIPALPWDSLPRPPKNPKKALPLSEWRKWFLSTASEPAPGAWPPKAASNGFAKMAAGDIERALGRAMEGASDCLAKDKPSPQGAAWWMLAMHRAWLRFREVAGQDAVAQKALGAGELFGRLASAANYAQESLDQLLSAAEVRAQSDHWRREFATGMWRAFQDPRSGSAGDLLGALSGAPGQAALARELVPAAFRAVDSQERSLALDPALDRLSLAARTSLMRDLMVRSAAGEASGEGVLAFFAASRHAGALPTSTERLDLLVTAALVLRDSTGIVTRQASEIIGQAVADSPPDAYGVVWCGLLAGVREHIDNLHKEHGHDLENLRLSHERQLEERRMEGGRQDQEIRRLRTQILSSREESRMDILEDILTVLSETLQSIRPLEDRPEELFRHVEARLALALRAGGAEEFGTIGETVSYDPTQHQAATEIPIRSPVCVAARGAVMRGKVTGDRVLMKARVEIP